MPDFNSPSGPDADTSEREAALRRIGVDAARSSFEDDPDVLSASLTRVANALANLPSPRPAPAVEEVNEEDLRARIREGVERVYDTNDGRMPLNHVNVAEWVDSIAVMLPHLAVQSEAEVRADERWLLAEVLSNAGEDEAVTLLRAIDRMIAASPVPSPPRPERDVKAEALRQAADDIQIAARAGWTEQARRTAVWLRDRADSLARSSAGDPTEGGENRG